MIRDMGNFAEIREIRENRENRGKHDAERGCTEYAKTGKLLILNDLSVWHDCRISRKVARNLAVSLWHWTLHTARKSFSFNGLADSVKKLASEGKKLADGLSPKVSRRCRLKAPGMFVSDAWS
jgi:hypothetical protein